MAGISDADIVDLGMPKAPSKDGMGSTSPSADMSRLKELLPTVNSPSLSGEANGVDTSNVNVGATSAKDGGSAVDTETLFQRKTVELSKRVESLTKAPPERGVKDSGKVTQNPKTPFQRKTVDLNERVTSLTKAILESGVIGRGEITQNPETPFQRKTVELNERVKSLTKATPESGVNGSGEVVRKFLHCEECSASGTSVCDSCKKVFLSDEWRDLNTDWSKRKLAPPRRKSMTVADSKRLSLALPKDSSLLEAQQTIAALKADKARLEAELQGATEQNEELADELDGYKRALKFARNFIESEAVEHKHRKSEYTTQSKVAALVEMYRKQLAQVTDENVKLSNALNAYQMSKGFVRNYEATNNLAAEETEPVYHRQVEKAGAFTWTLE